MKAKPRSGLTLYLVAGFVIVGGILLLADDTWAEIRRHDVERCLEKKDDHERVKCFRELVKEEGIEVPLQPDEPTYRSNLCDPKQLSWTECHSEWSRISESVARTRAEWRRANTRQVIEENMESSYITFGSGKRFGGDKTGANLLLEGQIFKNIHWFANKDAGREANNQAGEDAARRMNYWVDIPIRFVVRQLTDTSQPVRTPTFNPGLRLYLGPADSTAWKSTRQYYSVGLHHYSNGQDDLMTLADGSVNTKSGTFSTNYLDLAAHVFGNMGAVNWARLSFRQHFYGTFESEMRNQYAKRHLSLEGRTREFLPFGEILPIHLKLTGTYGWGHKYVVLNRIDESKNVEARLKDRLNTTVELIARPNFDDSPTPTWRKWRDVAVYLRYDHGYDYYNVRFQNRINRLQIGVVTTNF